MLRIIDILQSPKPLLLIFTRLYTITGLDWTTGLPLKLKLQHYNNILGLNQVWFDSKNTMAYIGHSDLLDSMTFIILAVLSLPNLLWILVLM